MEDAASRRLWRLEKATRFLRAPERALEVEDWETAVSRAYYAAYHAVIILLETKTTLTLPRRHAQLHNLLRSPMFPPLLDREQVANFAELYIKRQSADYDEDAPDFEIAEASLNKARLIFEIVARMVNDAQV